MTTVRDVERFLYDWAPAGLAAEWDNVGLLVGDPEREVRRILTTLDITEAVVEEAIGAGVDLIVSHPHQAGRKPHFRHLHAHQSGRGGGRCQ